MQIKLNGKLQSIQSQNLDALVREQGLTPSCLVIEHNLEVIKQENWARTEIREGDVVELLNFVGGG